jgi:hypothetical protein
VQLYTVSAVKSEASKKIRQKKRLGFFSPDFFYMRYPCPFLQVDSVSLCSDSVFFIIKKRYFKKVVFVFCASALKKSQNSLFGKEKLIL